MLAASINAVALMALVASARCLPGAKSQVSASKSNSQPAAKSQISTASSNSQPSTNLCGNDQHIILDGTPWLVANSMYGAGQMVGTSCTEYRDIETSGGSQVVSWGNTISIQEIEST